MRKSIIFSIVFLSTIILPSVSSAKNAVPYGTVTPSSISGNVWDIGIVSGCVGSSYGSSGMLFYGFSGPAGTYVAGGSSSWTGCGVSGDFNGGNSVTMSVGGALSGYASTTGTYYVYFCSGISGSHCTSDDPSLAIRYASFYWNGSTAVADGQVGYGSQIDTFISGVVPVNNADVDSEIPVFLEAYGNIHEDDASAETFVKWNIYSKSQDLLGNCVDVICATNSVHLGQDIYSIPMDSSGYFDIASTTSVPLSEGWYQMTTSVVKMAGFWGFLGVFDDFLSTNFGDTILVSTTTSFLIGSSSPMDLILNSISGATPGTNPATPGGFLGSASTTAQILNDSSCNFMSFNIGGCFKVLFFPNFIQIGGILTQLQNGVGMAMPWGYVTRFMVIVSGNATTTMPTISIPIPNISAGSINYSSISGTLALNPWNNLMGSTSMLGTATSTVTGKTFRGIVEPGWDMLVWLVFIIAVIHDVIGMNQHDIGLGKRDDKKEKV